VILAAPRSTGLLVVVPALRMMFLERQHGSHASPDAPQLTPAE